MSIKNSRLLIAIFGVLGMASCLVKSNNLKLEDLERVDDKFYIIVEQPNIELDRIINNKPYFKVDFGFNTDNYSKELEETRFGLFFRKEDKNDSDDQFKKQTAQEISQNTVSQDVFVFNNEVGPIKGKVSDIVSAEINIIVHNENYDFYAFVADNKNVFYSQNKKIFNYDLGNPLNNIINQSPDITAEIKKAEVSFTVADYKFELEGEVQGDANDDPSITKQKFFVFIKKDSGVKLGYIEKKVYDDLVSKPVGFIQHSKNCVVAYANDQDYYEAVIPKENFIRGADYEVYFVYSIIDTNDTSKVLEYHSEQPKEVSIPKPDVQLKMKSVQFEGFYCSLVEGHLGARVSLSLEGEIEKALGISDKYETGFMVINKDDDKDNDFSKKVLEHHKNQFKVKISKGKDFVPKATMAISHDGNQTIDDIINFINNKKVCIYYLIDADQNLYLSGPLDITFWPNIKDFAKLDKDTSYDFILEGSNSTSKLSLGDTFNNEQITIDGYDDNKYIYGLIPFNENLGLDTKFFKDDKDARLVLKSDLESNRNYYGINDPKAKDVIKVPILDVDFKFSNVGSIGNIKYANNGNNTVALAPVIASKDGKVYFIGDAIIDGIPIVQCTENETSLKVPSIRYEDRYYLVGDNITLSKSGVKGDIEFDDLVASFAKVDEIVNFSHQEDRIAFLGQKFSKLEFFDNINGSKINSVNELIESIIQEVNKNKPPKYGEFKGNEAADDNKEGKVE